MVGKLVNLGSLCIDHVYSVPEITGPGETVASLGHEVFPGGKGLNQSVAAARAGAEVTHFGCVGEDGAWLKEVLAEAGVDASGVRVATGASGHAVIQVNAAGENAIVIAGGSNRELTEADVTSALDALGPGDWLLLQNEINDLEGVLAAAADRGARVAFNVAPVDGREAGYDLSGTALLIVNEIEAAALAGEDDPPAALRSLCQRYPNMDVVLTLGREGLLYANRDETRTMPAYSVQAVDETAAGDAFIGYLMATLLAGDEMAPALRKASAAGALAVTRAGAASSIPPPAEVEALLASGG
ncbi:MAG: ribokinase [Gammaproteobacteria bacterium]|nr:ribokinase [Gammaproteobacteria bacterium]MYB38529.1 ribokinase [Gammaproteobacteria bacterium]